MAGRVYWLRFNCNCCKGWGSMPTDCGEPCLRTRSVAAQSKLKLVTSPRRIAEFIFMVRWSCPARQLRTTIFPSLYTCLNCLPLCPVYSASGATQRGNLGSYSYDLHWIRARVPTRFGLRESISYPLGGPSRLGSQQTPHLLPS